MKRGSPVRNRLRGHAWPLLISVLWLVAAPSLVHSDTNTNSSSAEQQKLIEAQTRYYDEQTQKLKEERSPLQKIFTLSSFLGALLGAFLAASVALISFVFNYRATLRSKQDTEFYETLKRLGDKDSPTIRVSAAGILAQMGTKKESLYDWRKPYVQLTTPYFETALDQLVAASQLEENRISITSIGHSLRQLIAIDHLRVLRKTHEANLELQWQLIIALAEFFASKGADHFKEMEKYWPLAAAICGYEQAVLHTLMGRYLQEFFSLLESGLQTSGKLEENGPSGNDVDLEVTSKSARSRRIKGRIQLHGAPATAPPSRLAAAPQALEVVANRLRANVEVYSQALRANPAPDLQPTSEEDQERITQASLTTMSLAKAFLVKANLTTSHLQGVDFEEAQLQSAEFFQADLRKANLYAADMQGANLIGADLREAKMTVAQLGPLQSKYLDGQVSHETPTHLSNAQLESADLTFATLTDAKLDSATLDGVVINQDTNMQGANWWKSDFKSDVRLLEQLYARYRESVPSSDQVSRSVRLFIEARTASNG